MSIRQALTNARAQILLLGGETDEVNIAHICEIDEALADLGVDPPPGNPQVVRVEISGPARSGKSTVAQHLARSLADVGLMGDLTDSGPLPGPNLRGKRHVAFLRNTRVDIVVRQSRKPARRRRKSP